MLYNNIFFSVWESTSFAYPVGPSQDGILGLHSTIMIYGLGILAFVFILLSLTYISFSDFKHGRNTRVARALKIREKIHAAKRLHHGSDLEIIWTVVPALILLTIAYPSLQLLYAIDEVIEPSLTIKVGGRQWYWNYAYTDDFKIGGSLENQVTQGLTRVYNISFSEMYRLVAYTLRLFDLKERGSQPPLLKEFSSFSETFNCLRAGKNDPDLIDEQRARYAAWKSEPDSSIFDIIKSLSNLFVFEYINPIDGPMYRDQIRVIGFDRLIPKFLSASLPLDERIGGFVRLVDSFCRNSLRAFLHYTSVSAFLERAQLVERIRSRFEFGSFLQDGSEPESFSEKDMSSCDWPRLVESDLSVVGSSLARKHFSDPFDYKRVLAAGKGEGAWCVINSSHIGRFLESALERFTKFNIELVVPIKDSTGVEAREFEFDSYMVPDQLLKPGQRRLLTTDQPLVVPSNTHLRFIITSADVLHSFAVPSAGIKVDAVPGRLNQVSAYFSHECVVYGQCSELCGVNHGFMPIEVMAVRPLEYMDWLSSKNGLSAPMPYFETPEKIFKVSEAENGWILGGQEMLKYDPYIFAHLEEIKLVFELKVFPRLHDHFMSLTRSWAELARAQSLLPAVEFKRLYASFNKISNLPWIVTDKEFRNSHNSSLAKFKDLKVIRGKLSAVQNGVENSDSSGSSSFFFRIIDQIWNYLVLLKNLFVDFFAWLIEIIKAKIAELNRIAESEDYQRRQRWLEHSKEAKKQMDLASWWAEEARRHPDNPRTPEMARFVGDYPRHRKD